MSEVDLSIVIPLGPGDGLPRQLLAALPPGDSDQRIVSATQPAPADLPADVEWIHGERGRGRQLNRGAEAATGQWIWFLHADSRLEAGAVERVHAFIRLSEAVIGYCRLRYLDDGPPAAALNALGANWRSRFLGRPYGDQGLCLPRDAFWRLGGFREDLVRGEDLDFVVRARGVGLRTRCMGPTIWTSARRYRERGWLRTTLEHRRNARRLIRDARRGEDPT